MLLDVKSSDMAMDLLRQAGSAPEVWKTGHSHIKKRMKEVGAPLAGEMSGHIFIADNYYGFDDAIYAGMRVLDQCVRTGFDITAFMDSLPEQHATPELRVPCPDSDKFAAMDTITAHVLAANDPNAVSTIDGVRVRTDGGWWLLRASNTEAVQRTCLTIWSGISAVRLAWPTSTGNAADNWPCFRQGQGLSSRLPRY